MSEAGRLDENAASGPAKTRLDEEGNEKAKAEWLREIGMAGVGRAML